MANPDDSWRHQQSAAPHAPAHDPVTPGLPLGQQSSSFDAPSADAAPATARSGSGSLGAVLAVGLMLLLFGAPILGTMYPLAAGSAFVVYLLTKNILGAGLGPDASLPFALLAGLIVLWIVSRRDHRLADASPTYRRVRHIARIVLIGVFVAVTSLHEFDHGSWPTSMDEAGVIMGDPRFWIGLAVTAVIAHLLLTRAARFRDLWHLCLEPFRLRPAT